MTAVTNDTAALCGEVVSSRTLETHTELDPLRPSNGSGAESVSGVMVSELLPMLGWVQPYSVDFIEVPALSCGQP